MAIKQYQWTGMVKWAKLFKPDEKYGYYSLNFYPSSDHDRRAIKATGIKNNAKEDEDGFYYVLRNKEQPRVVDSEGNAFENSIGNGSICTINLVVEDFTSKTWGKVVRSTLAAVRVDNWVEYNPDKEENFFKPEPASSGTTKPKLPF